MTFFYFADYAEKSINFCTPPAPGADMAWWVSVSSDWSQSNSTQIMQILTVIWECHLMKKETLREL